MNPRQIFVISSVVVSTSIFVLSYFNSAYLWWFLLFGPLIIIGIIDVTQKKKAIRRNFPLIGNLRYLLESIRPEIMQYFVETDIEGRPINRINRSLIYQRAKNVTDTTPFGTQMNVYDVGYEWLDHSVYGLSKDEINYDQRIVIGNKDCKQPYASSVMNISAMSYGSLSKNAVLALNKGAKIGGFAQNTGEGGISPYHLQNGGDLIWQIGTGYFGCRNDEGRFDEKLFQDKANLEQVKMIEIKLSQGAKPGHGGMLPATKNTEEIAKIRNIKPHTNVFSPPSHSAFKNATEMMFFIKKLRDLSGGKPVGFKLCIGKKLEFYDLCKAMIETGIKPDYIVVDGGEGGTGAAPIEFSNHMGMPLKDALIFVYESLVGFNLKDEIKLIASGKILSGFDIVKTLAIGADLVYSARAMMMAIGCIQALQCNSNTCPVGVATQDKRLMRGLDIENKAQRTANFHQKTIHSFTELIGAAGLRDHKLITRSYINKRISQNEFKTYEDLYPTPKKGFLLEEYKYERQSHLN